MASVHRVLLACLVLAGGLRPNHAQNLLPNPRFEAGTTAPTGWRLMSGKGRWVHETKESARIEAQGDGEDSSEWRSDSQNLNANGHYRVQFRGRREPGASGGTAVAGPTRMNRDFPLDQDWQLYQFVFSAPSDATQDQVRFGQWHVRGGVSFEEVRLTPVFAVHLRLADGTELGEGESLDKGVYHFSPEFNWLGANSHRPLATNRASFNSDRWVFGPTGELVYRHQIGHRLQHKARVRVALSYYVQGRLEVSACANGTKWVALGSCDGAKMSGWFELPTNCFPATSVDVRLAQTASDGSLQVGAYEYEAAVDDIQTEAIGATRFVGRLAEAPGIEVEGIHLAASSEDGQQRLVMRVRNHSPTLRRARGTIDLDGVLLTNQVANLRLRTGESGEIGFAIPPGGAGDHALTINLADSSGHVLFRGDMQFVGRFLDDTQFGYLLPGPKALGVWWCESGWKVGRDRGLPSAHGDPAFEAISVSAAKGEFEAAQVVLRPTHDGRLLGAKVGPLRGVGREVGPISVGMDEVAYVRVTQPTDGSCLAGFYPDPLPPLRTPLELHAGQNQPVWITFHVSPETRAGDYHGKLEMKTTLGHFSVPLTVHVYDFALPKETHLKSALGLGTQSISRYHHATNDHDRRLVYSNYLRNFADHRISPYSFYDLDPIIVGFEGDGAERHARVDFSQFDKAAHQWLDLFRFNTFQVPIEGMGGGTFQARYLGKLDGFAEGTPEHARLFHDYLSQVENHLRENGWLDKAFVYWFDEPDTKDFEFVAAGMDRLKAAAPGLKRMLTKQPEPGLLGHVDIWCGLTPEWTPARVQERRAQGQEVWWYICTGPKAPFVTEFIDHPGTELRLWPWQSWQYGVTGVLIWATTYWTSPLVYPEPQAQNPWQDPMSWMEGYGHSVGFVSPWGNGDGRFLYPPRTDPNRTAPASLDDPINSIRWECLRDGMEDYEYLWLLEGLTQRIQAKRGETSQVREARQLLVVPPQISKDLTHFTADPRPLLQHRDRVAQMIEKLQRLR